MIGKYLADRRIENSRGTRYFSGRTSLNGRPMSTRALGGISKVKSWVKKGIWENPPKTDKHSFIDTEKREFVPKMNPTSYLFTDLGLKKGKFYAMYDIKSAFPNVALVYGLINKDIHEYLNDIPDKIEKLACLGASSSDKTVYSLDREGKETSQKEVPPVSVGFFNCILSALDDWTINHVLNEDKKGIVKAVYMDAIFVEIEKGTEKDVLDLINSINAVDKEIQFLPKKVYKYLGAKEIKDFNDRSRYLSTFVEPSGKKKQYLFQRPNK